GRPQSRCRGPDMTRVFALGDAGDSRITCSRAANDRTAAQNAQLITIDFDAIKDRDCRRNFIASRHAGRCRAGEIEALKYPADTGPLLLHDAFVALRSRHKSATLNPGCLCPSAEDTLSAGADQMVLRISIM